VLSDAGFRSIPSAGFATTAVIIIRLLCIPYRHQDHHHPQQFATIQCQCSQPQEIDITSKSRVKEACESSRLCQHFRAPLPPMPDPMTVQNTELECLFSCHIAPTMMVVGMPIREVKCDSPAPLIHPSEFRELFDLVHAYPLSWTALNATSHKSKSYFGRCHFVPVIRK